MVDRKGHSADYPGTLWINRRHSNDHTHVRRQKERFGEFLNIFTCRSTTRINYEQSSLSTSFASPLSIEALNERIQSFAKAFPSAGLGLHPLGTEIRGYTIDF
jgi:hypothetical protein